MEKECTLTCQEEKGKFQIRDEWVCACVRVCVCVCVCVCVDTVFTFFPPIFSLFRAAPGIVSF